MTGERHRVVIVGAGVNGLVAALALARQGRAPLVFERRASVGGIAATEEFQPGFRASMVAPAAGPLTPRVLAEAELAGQGLEWLESPTRVFLSGTSGDKGLALSSDPQACAEAIGKISPADAARYRETREALGAMAGFFSHFLESTPLALDSPGRGELFSAGRLGLKLRRLGRKNMLRVLRWLPMPAADLAEEWFESEWLRAAVATRGVFAATMGPRSPGTAARVLFQVGASGDPFAPLIVPRGGMGALGEALARAARAAGAEIRTEAEVGQILVKDGRATGVALTSGEEVPAVEVISGADPSCTLLRLIDPANLSAGFLRQARSYRIAGSVALVHLALDALPGFHGAGEVSAGQAPTALAGRIQIGQSIDEIEKAFDDAKYGRISNSPLVELTIPTILDPGLAPPGKHVLSAWMQFAPYRLAEGDWSGRRAELLPLLLRRLEPYAPGISGLVVGSRVLSPADLEQQYGLTGGHVFHGELAMDQMYSLRPLFGMGGYRGPIEGLYLCGAGTHPGIGITGASGLNAARELINDQRRRSR